MSDTMHHRKPGTPRRPRKGYIAEGRTGTALRRAMFAGDDTLGTFEPTSTRRTR